MEQIKDFEFKIKLIGNDGKVLDTITGYVGDLKSRSNKNNRNKNNNGHSRYKRNKIWNSKVRNKFEKSKSIDICTFTFSTCHSW